VRRLRCGRNRKEIIKERRKVDEGMKGKEEQG
jgi:hypothetical protein